MISPVTPSTAIPDELLTIRPQPRVRVKNRLYGRNHAADVRV
jgi:hypothetical protein